jgi:hypothetical protein
VWRCENGEDWVLLLGMNDSRSAFLFAIFSDTIEAFVAV